MDKKYKFKLNKKINITLIAIALICIIGIICDAVFMTFAIKDELSVTAYIISLALLIVLLAFIPIFIFGSSYTLGKDKFTVSLCFIKKTIAYSDLLNIRHDANINQTIMYYYTYNKSGEQLVSMVYLNLDSKNLDSFVQDLKDKNNMIIYDIFNKEEDNAKN